MNIYLNDFEFVDNENVLEKITGSDFNPINLSYINKNDKIYKIRKIKNNNVDSKRYIELVSWDTDKIILKLILKNHN